MRFGRPFMSCVRRTRMSRRGEVDPSRQSSSVVVGRGSVGILLDGDAYRGECRVRDAPPVAHGPSVGGHALGSSVLGPAFACAGDSRPRGAWSGPRGGDRASVGARPPDPGEESPRHREDAAQPPPSDRPGLERKAGSPGDGAREKKSKEPHADADGLLIINTDGGGRRLPRSAIRRARTIHHSAVIRRACCLGGRTRTGAGALPGGRLVVLRLVRPGVGCLGGHGCTLAGRRG